MLKHNMLSCSSIYAHLKVICIEHFTTLLRTPRTRNWWPVSRVVNTHSSLLCILCILFPPLPTACCWYSGSIRRKPTKSCLRDLVYLFKKSRFWRLREILSANFTYARIWPKTTTTFGLSKKKRGVNVLRFELWPRRSSSWCHCG